MPKVSHVFSSYPEKDGNNSVLQDLIKASYNK